MARPSGATMVVDCVQLRLHLVGASLTTTHYPNSDLETRGWIMVNHGASVKGPGRPGRPEVGNEALVWFILILSSHALFFGTVQSENRNSLVTITGTCILHSIATSDDPMFSDHPALSFENKWSSGFLRFSFFPLSVQVCLLWCSTFPPRYGPKASSVNRNQRMGCTKIWLLILGNQKTQEETQRN